MYTTYFIIGFVTSFGWWSAGKVQKAVDVTATPPPITAVANNPDVKK